MAKRFVFGVLALGLSLGAFTQPQPSRQGAMSGTAAGSSVDPLSAASRERAGEGCPNASAGMPSIVGNTTTGHPHIAYDTRTASAGVGNPNARLAPGGEANSCN